MRDRENAPAVFAAKQEIELKRHEKKFLVIDCNSEFFGNELHMLANSESNCNNYNHEFEFVFLSVLLLMLNVKLRLSTML